MGAHLKSLRTVRGLTQEQAAVQAGITRNTLMKLENAKRPNTELVTLLRLMRVYNLESFDALLGPLPAAQVAAAWAEAGWKSDMGNSSAG